MSQKVLGDLDLNNQSRILNLLAPVGNTEPLRLQDVVKPQLIFHAYRDGNITSPAINATIIYNTVVTNIYTGTNPYNSTTGVYTLQQDMFLWVSARARMQPSGTTPEHAVTLRYGGTDNERDIRSGSGGSSIDTYLNLTAGTALSAIWNYSSGTAPIFGNSSDTFMKIVRFG